MLLSVIGAGKHSMIHPYHGSTVRGTGAHWWYMFCPKSAKTLTAHLHNIATRDTGFGLFGLSTTLKITEVLWSRISASVFKTNSDWHWKFYDTGTISCNPSFKSVSDRLVTWLASSPVNLRMKQFQNSTPSIEIGPSRRVPMKGDMYCNNVSMK